jgi:hypothetical protein
MHLAVRFGSSGVVAAVIGLGLIFASGGALAQSGLPGVKITEVLVEFDETFGDTIMIVGANFDNGGSPIVTLGHDPTPLAIIGTPTGSEIVVECPWGEAVPECVDGDFLLMITTGLGPVHTGTYALTIGEVGPQGARGEPGLQGPPGPGIVGQRCGDGEVVVGFGTDGELICTPLLRR